MRERPSRLVDDFLDGAERGSADLVRGDPEEVLRDRETVAEGGLRAFVPLAWSRIDPAPFRHNWHVDAICDHLEACRRREIRRLIINQPPGTSKTSITSVLWPAHVGTEIPPWAWITASYTPTLATRDSRRHRDLCRSDWYAARWPKATCDNAQGASNWTNVSGGWRLATSPGGAATGFHADGHIVDDPIKPSDARETKRSDLREALERAIVWWDETMSTRAKDRSTLIRVIIMQRLHDMDLSGVAMGQGYEHLVLPMEYNPKIMWVLYPDREKEGGTPYCQTALGRPDPRREPGELLDPVRYPREEVNKLRGDLKDAAAAQLDQTPIAPGGGLFKESYFGKRWTLDSLPEPLQLFSSWDLRFKEDAEAGSFVVGQLWGYSVGKPDLYLIHQVRGRWGYAQTRDEFLKFVQGWPMCFRHLVENKANGPALESDLKRKKIKITLVDAMGSKTLRANIAEPAWRDGHVWIPADDVPGADWVKLFVREHTRFPRFGTDDQVDASSQAVTWYQTEHGAKIGDYLANVAKARRAK